MDKERLIRQAGRWMQGSSVHMTYQPDQPALSDYLIFFFDSCSFCNAVAIDNSVVANASTWPREELNIHNKFTIYTMHIHWCMYIY
jgi:hypothetical protein